MGLSSPTSNRGSGIALKWRTAGNDNVQSSETLISQKGKTIVTWLEDQATKREHPESQRGSTETHGM